MNTELSTTAAANFRVVLNSQDVLKKMNDDEFEQFCRYNPHLQIELTKQEELIITPTGIAEFGKWENQ